MSFSPLILIIVYKYSRIIIIKTQNEQMSKIEQKKLISPNPSFCSTKWWIWTRFQTKFIDSTIINQTIKIIDPAIIDIEDFLSSKEEAFDISFLEDIDNDNNSTGSIEFV